MDGRAKFYSSAVLLVDGRIFLLVSNSTILTIIIQWIVVREEKVP